MCRIIYNHPVQLYNYLGIYIIPIISKRTLSKSALSLKNTEQLDWLSYKFKNVYIVLKTETVLAVIEPPR